MYRIFFRIIYLLLLLIPSANFAETGDEIPQYIAGTDSTSLDSSKAELPQSQDIKSSSEKSKKDSVENFARRTFLLLKETTQRGTVRKHPKAIDSLFNNRVILPHRVMQSDGPNLFDVLVKEPAFTPVKRTLSSGQNSALYYGIPTPIIKLTEKGELLTPYPYASALPDRFTPRETYQIYISPLEITSKLYPRSFVTPQTAFLWEGGIKVFHENMFNVRLTRPFTKNLHLGIFTNYQHLNRTHYTHDHSAGDIYRTYKRAYKKLDVDTTLVADTGTNPLTNEFITGVRLFHENSDGRTIKVSYRYGDIKADLPFEYLPIEPDSTDTTAIDTLTSNSDSTLDSTDNGGIFWRESAHYEHQISVKIDRQKISDRVGISGDILFQKSDNFITPTQIKDSIRFRGSRLTTGGAISPYFLLNKKDIVSLNYSVRRVENSVYDKATLTTHESRININYKNILIDKKRLKSDFNLAAGYAIVNLNDNRQYSPTISAIGNIKFGAQNISLFFKNDILPPIVPYNSTSISKTDHIDTYQTFGTEALFAWKSHGVLLGYRGIRNMKTRSDSLYWSNGIAPYKTPENSFLITPSLFTGKPVSLTTQWIFADEKPFVKSKSNLKFHIHRKENIQHIFLDFDLNYWSLRNPIIFGGVDTWSEKILNLDFKITLQITTFRLFYRMDNLFNRKNSYVPGYTLPGLILRWGVNWQITG